MTYVLHKGSRTDRDHRRLRGVEFKGKAKDCEFGLLHDSLRKIRPVNTAKTERAEKGRTKPASQDEQKGFDCNRCGYKHEYKKCPAFGQTCKSCQKNNHLAKMCKAQGHTRKMHAVEQ